MNGRTGRLSTLRNGFALLIAKALLLAAPAAAFAQNAPPEPRVTRLYPVWIGYAMTFVLLLAVIGVSLMPSKRAHQD